MEEKSIDDIVNDPKPTKDEHSTDIQGFETLTPQEQHQLLFLSSLIVIILTILIARRLS